MEGARPAPSARRLQGEENRHGGGRSPPRLKEVRMTERKKLDAAEIDVDSLEVEELDAAAGGIGDQNQNCYSCTCPPRQQEPAIEPILV